MKLIIAFLALMIPAISAANPITDINQDKAIADIRTNLTAKYPDNYASQNMLLKANKRALSWLSERPEGAPHDAILRRLVSEYYPNFAAIKMLYKAEIKAYEELNGK